MTAATAIPIAGFRDVYSLPDVERALQSGIGNAKLAGRSELRADDVAEPRAGRRQRIGF